MVFKEYFIISTAWILRVYETTAPLTSLTGVAIYARSNISKCLEILYFLLASLLCLHTWINKSYYILGNSKNLSSLFKGSSPFLKPFLPTDFSSQPFSRKKTLLNFFFLKFNCTFRTHLCHLDSSSGSQHTILRQSYCL